MEGVGFIDMWLSVVGGERDGLHLAGKDAAVLGCVCQGFFDEGICTVNYLNKMRRGN